MLRCASVAFGHRESSTPGRNASSEASVKSSNRFRITDRASSQPVPNASPEANVSVPALTMMPDNEGRPLNVVQMNLDFDVPIDSAVYDYFHPVLTT